MKREKVLVELDIESIGFEGVSVARKEGKVYLLKGGLPGEKVVAALTKSKKNYNEGYIEKVLESSPERVEALCDYFSTCGGCSWQDLEYKSQLKWKKHHVEDTFARLGKITPEVIFDTMPSESIFEYRNKMDFSFGALRWLTPSEINTDEEINKQFALGLHVPGKFDKIIDIKKCHIHPAIGNEVLSAVRKQAMNNEINPYHYLKHSGFLKNVILRYSHFEKSIMSILITSPAENDKEKEFADWFVYELPKLFSEIKVSIHAENDVLSTAAYGEIKRRSSDVNLKETILGVEFEISPFSFFQTNSVQLDSFIGKIMEYAELNDEMTVWDLYSGCGSITLPVAKKVKQIIGIELVEGAVADANKNAQNNNIENVRFFQSDLHSKRIPTLLNRLPKPDLIIVDPPRIGLNENLINHILEVAPERIVYVSCNPGTQARDLALLSVKYKVGKVQPVDMFPHTYHIETVVELIKTN